MTTKIILPWLAFFYHTLSQPIDRAVANGSENRLGWESSPNGRGTLDIIYSCASTAFLCSWSILNLNVPSIDDTKFAFIRRKLWLTALCFLGPEFILSISGSQWSSARSSWKQWQNAGYSEWSMYHSFFADMGGFMLITPDFPTFPIDSKQLLCLVQCQVVKLPDFKSTQIADRNKVDGLLRFITLLQTGWFCINIAGRAAGHLAITTLELTTAAFLVCNIATVVFWYHKPADVTTSEHIKTNLPIKEIVIKAETWMEKHDSSLNHGSTSKVTHRHPCYERTPLEFISREEWDWSLYWGNWIHILRNFRVPMIDFVPKTLPVNRFGNSRVPHKPATPLYCFLLSLSVVYSGIFLAGWNYQFPTPVERLLWRIASLTLLCIVFGYWALSVWGFTVYPALRQKLKDLVLGKQAEQDAHEKSYFRRWVGSPKKFGNRCHRIANALRNNSVSKDPMLTVPLKIIVPIHLLGLFYCLSRTYILLSDILELRSLPPSAFDTVDWSSFFPHL
jgi:hypothetical protein